MISRFLIDLQEANIRMNYQHSLGSMTSLNFERFAGSVGASLPAPFSVSKTIGEDNDEPPQVDEETNHIQVVDTPHQVVGSSI